MQALKDDEDAFGELRIKADAVVAHGEDPLLPFLLRSNMDTRRRGAMKLDSIADQILEYHHQLSGIPSDHWQGFMGDACSTLFNRKL